MTEHICHKCQKVFSSKQSLTNHLNKKYSCDSGAYSCQKCGQKFAHRQGRFYHQKYVCQGPVTTMATLQAELEQLKKALCEEPTQLELENKVLRVENLRLKLGRNKAPGGV